MVRKRKNSVSSVSSPSKKVYSYNHEYRHRLHLRCDEEPHQSIKRKKHSHNTVQDERLSFPRILHSSECKSRNHKNATFRRCKDCQKFNCMRLPLEHNEIQRRIQSQITQKGDASPCFRPRLSLLRTRTGPRLRLRIVRLAARLSPSPTSLRASVASPQRPGYYYGVISFTDSQVTK